MTFIYKILLENVFKINNEWNGTTHLNAESKSLYISFTNLRSYNSVWFMGRMSGDIDFIVISFFVNNLWLIYAKVDMFRANMFIIISVG